MVLSRQRSIKMPDPTPNTTLVPANLPPKGSGRDRFEISTPTPSFVSGEQVSAGHASPVCRSHLLSQKALRSPLKNCQAGSQLALMGMVFGAEGLLGIANRFAMSI
jgi:hypothetical protein